MLRTLVAVAAAAALAAAGVDAAGREHRATARLDVLAQLDPRTDRRTADVWFHEGLVYLGDYPGRGERGCLSSNDDGIMVVDVRSPSRPRRLARLPVPDGRWAEDVSVYQARSGPRAGADIAVVGVQICSRADASAPEVFRGLLLWDVSDPLRPVELSRYDSGCCAPGVHVVEVTHRRDLGRTFAYVTVPGAERRDARSPSGRLDRRGRGDFRLVDITDPADPREVSDWGVRRSLRRTLGRPRGCSAVSVAHAAEPSADGKLVFVSNWDSGFIALDVTNPARPRFRGRTVYGSRADGDAHSTAYDERRKLLFAADEDFCPDRRRGIEGGWGYLRVYDVSNLRAPRQIGSFRTRRSRGTSRRGAVYTIHNPLLVGTDVYASWYGDGVRVVDTRNPRRPSERASFVPPAPAVWGVAVDPARRLVFASDLDGGLWILRLAG